MWGACAPVEPNCKYTSGVMEMEDNTTVDDNQHDQPPRKSSRGEECRVCGDTASGKHYGVTACHGCRSFFRRAVKRKRKYFCVYGGQCLIKVNERKQCKFCRYQKSLIVGMKYDVPDAIGKSEEKEPHAMDVDVKPTPQSMSLAVPSPLFPTASVLGTFHQAESQICPKFAPYFPKTNLRAPANLQDVADGLTVELRYLVDWAKQIQVFNQLDMDSRIAALRAHGTELIFLETIRRSMDVDDGVVGDECFVGANGFAMMRHGKDQSPVRPRVFNELMEPCKKMRVTEEEFQCLKAIVMFNPWTNGLSDKDRDKAGRFMEQVKMALENGRMFNLLMILPSVSSIAEQMRALMRSRKGVAFTTTSKLLDDLVLHHDEGVGPY